MSKESGDGDGLDADVPDAVKEWLGSIAAEHDVSEAALLEALLADGPASEATSPGSADLERLEDRFRSLIDDIRDRVIQVKRETDGKAPADHDHHELAQSIEQVGQEVAAIEDRLDQLEDRLEAGFENYEEILTYLTETADRLDGRLQRVATAVMGLREQVDAAARDRARRTALNQLSQSANRHGVTRARCDSCGASVDMSLLVEPRCPHCDTVFASLEPRSGFFRTSVLHTGSLPALEAGGDDSGAETELASIADGAAGTREPSSPTAPGAAAPELESIQGIGSTYARRLREAGIDDVASLAAADAETVGDEIGVAPGRVANWIAEAADHTGRGSSAGKAGDQ